MTLNGSAPSGLTRRGFLVLGGGTAGLAVVGGCGLDFDWGKPPAGSSPAALVGGYPRVIAFRQSEWLVPVLSYADWADVFAPFSGIIGKALQEENTDTSGPRNVEYFTRFKQENPEKLVLLHLNGRARRPGFETDGWSPGWWLYRKGSVLTAAIQSEDTVLPVASTSLFRLGPDRNGDIGDDIVIAPMGSGGKPDFTAAEQVRLTAIDRAASSLRVLRGRYGTSPLSFPRGAYLGRHVYAGPWSTVDDRVWMYNLSTTCPPDASGRRAVDVLLEQFASWFAADGVLAAFDGLQLDVFQLTTQDRRDVDADCDGVVDRAFQEGVDTYLEGQIQLSDGMRLILGPDRYLLSDGGVGQEPDMASFNGIELEGFPKFDDYDIRRWSQALMALEVWRIYGARPRLSYPLFKFAPPHDYPVSFNRFRLAFAAALATNSMVTWFNEPGGTSTGPPDVAVWDECRGGSTGQFGWLGAVQGQVIHLAERKRDILDGAGGDWSSDFINAFIAPAVNLQVQSFARGPVLVVSRREASTSLTFTIPMVALEGPDVVLAFDLLAAPRRAYASTIGRECTVTVVGAGGELSQTVTVLPSFFHAVLGYHGIGPGPINVTISLEGDTPLRLRGLRVFAAPDTIVRGFSRGAVFANPSGHEADFDVAALFPGRRFNRIVGSSDQDPITNDGSSLGSMLTLGPLDALVVRAV